MKFNGPAPELVNARLAMLGLLAAAHAEVETGQTVWQQAAALSPTTALLLLLTVYGTLVPVTKGAKMEAFGECAGQCC